METHANCGYVAVLARLDEDVRARAFHRAAEIHLQFRVISALECRDAKHRNCVVGRHNYVCGWHDRDFARDGGWHGDRANLFADRVRHWNHRQAGRHGTAEINVRRRSISSQVCIR